VKAPNWNDGRKSHTRVWPWTNGVPEIGGEQSTPARRSDTLLAHSLGELAGGSALCQNRDWEGTYDGWYILGKAAISSRVSPFGWLQIIDRFHLVDRSCGRPRSAHVSQTTAPIGISSVIGTAFLLHAGGLLHSPVDGNDEEMANIAAVGGKVSLQRAWPPQKTDSCARPAALGRSTPSRRSGTLLVAFIRRVALGAFLWLASGTGLIQ